MRVVLAMEVAMARRIVLFVLGELNKDGAGKGYAQGASPDLGVRQVFIFWYYFA